MYRAQEQQLNVSVGLLPTEAEDRRRTAAAIQHTAVWLIRFSECDIPIRIGNLAHRAKCIRQQVFPCRSILPNRARANAIEVLRGIAAGRDAAGIIIRR